MNEGGLMSGELAIWAISQGVLLARAFLFRFVELLYVMLAFYAAAELVPTNLSAAVSNVVTDRGIISVVATKTPENDRLPSQTQTLTNMTSAEMVRAMEPEKTHGQVSDLLNPSTGVQIVGGLALFLWVQRFRNYWVGS
jgi:hypothetical protein